MRDIFVEKHRILLIDHNVHFRNMFRLFARHANVIASTAPNGAEGLELLEKFKMDCIVADADLPDLDIVEIKNTLAAMPVYERNANTPIISVTASDFTVRRMRRFYERGIKNYLLKTSFLSELNDVADKLCGEVKVVDLPETFPSPRIQHSLSVSYVN